MNKKQIELWYKEKYQSSPIQVSSKEIKTILSSECNCSSCGKSIFELDDYPNVNVKESEVLCEYCYKDKYMETCPLCEDYFEKATKPEEQILIISKEAIEEYDIDIKPGFYQVKKWPYHYGNIVSGFEGVFNDALELIRECDINSMLKRIREGRENEEVGAGECCDGCMNKYTGKTTLVNNYINKSYGKKLIKLMNEVISEGK